MPYIIFHIIIQMGVMAHSNDSALGLTELEMGFGTHFQSSDYGPIVEMGLTAPFKRVYDF